MVNFIEQTRECPWMKIQGYFYIHISIGVGEYLIKSTYYDTIENVLSSYLQCN